MDIILLQDQRNLGKRGQVVKVRPGFARNFLLPQGAALEATPSNLAFFAHQKKKIEAQHAKLRSEAAEIGALLAGTTVTIARRVGERDTLYGSVTAADIVEALAAKNISVDKRQLDLGSTPTLKKVGEHKVLVNLHSEITAEITVAIVPSE